mgnify:CR=1 FL=1
MDERRTDRRYPTLTPVVVDATDFAGRAGVTEDMSDTGLRLRTTAPLPIGTRVRVRWRLQTIAAEVEAVGVVVRECDSVPESLFEHSMGVRIDSPVRS